MGVVVKTAPDYRSLAAELARALEQQEKEKILERDRLPQHVCGAAGNGNDCAACLRGAALDKARKANLI